MFTDNRINMFQKFRETYKENILDESVSSGQCYFIVLENNITYHVMIANHDYGFYERWCLYKKNDKRDSSIIKHRLLKPSCFKYDQQGVLSKTDAMNKWNPDGVYYLNDIEYSKKDFFNHPLNKELIIARRFKLQ